MQTRHSKHKTALRARKLPEHARNGPLKAKQGSINRKTYGRINQVDRKYRELNGEENFAVATWPPHLGFC